MLVSLASACHFQGINFALLVRHAPFLVPPDAIPPYMCKMKWGFMGFQMFIKRGVNKARNLCETQLWDVQKTGSHELLCSITEHIKSHERHAQMKLEVFDTARSGHRKIINHVLSEWDSGLQFVCFPGNNHACHTTLITASCIEVNR